jgi:hypothetical protein
LPGAKEGNRSASSYPMKRTRCGSARGTAGCTGGGRAILTTCRAMRD